MNKKEALQKIEELKEFIKNEEKEKPKLYEGQLCYVWNSDYKERCIRVFNNSAQETYFFKHNINISDAHCWINYEPIPFDPRLCVPPDAVAYAVDCDNTGYWFTTKPTLSDNTYFWGGTICVNGMGKTYGVYDPIRGADPENSLIYWGDE